MPYICRPMKRLFSLILLALGWMVFAQNLTGKVIGIKDGDTVEILENRRPVVVRLAHVDAPEKKQAYGNAAKNYLSDLIFGQTVQVVIAGKNDRYGRRIGEIYLKNQNINKAMVRAGMAWHYVEYSNDPAYADLQTQAQKKKVGLWQEPRPLAPWNYRKQRRDEAAKKREAKGVPPQTTRIK